MNDVVNRIKESQAAWDEVRSSQKAGNLTITLKDNTMNDMIIDELKEKIAELEGENSDLEDRLAARDDALEELSDNRDEWKQRYDDLVEKVKELEYFVRFQ